MPTISLTYEELERIIHRMTTNTPRIYFDNEIASKLIKYFKGKIPYKEAYLKEIEVHKRRLEWNYII